MKLRLNLEIEGVPDDAIVPMAVFADALAKLPENRQSEPLLTLTTEPTDIAESFEVPRSLNEKTIKRDGYVWQFHKTDADNWPSALHGHDYEKGLKIDAIDGRIYDVGSKQCCAKLKGPSLLKLQSELRDSKDFEDKVASLIDPQKANDGMD